MPSSIDELLNNISLLEERIAELSREVIGWQDKDDALQEELNLYRRQRFGRSAELHPPQGEVFNEAEVEAEPPVNGDAACEPETSDSDVATLADDGAENSEPGKAKKRRPRLPPALPRKVITISLPPEAQICDCCNQPMHVMGEEIREELELIPAHVHVTRYVREKYSCRCCEQHGTTGSVKVAPVVPALIPKSYATPSLVAQIIVNKFQFALPLYRQETLFAGLDIPLSRQTQSQWLLKVADRLKPLRALMHKALLAQPLIFADETPLNVLSQASCQSYIWLYGSGRDVRDAEDSTPHLVLYHYPARTRAAVAVRQNSWLGIPVTCRLTATQTIMVRKRSWSGGMAHARRKFEEAPRAKPNTKVGKAVWALSLSQKLYRIEKACQGGPPEEVYRRRQSESLPLMEEFGQWLSKTEGLPKGYLGKAIGYCQKQWPKLMRYLEDGRLSIDNNRAERAIKPFVIGRKNWLFANTEAGAYASGLLYSLVEPARINGLNPYDYLLALLTALTSPDADIDWERLLPWNITLP